MPDDRSLLEREMDRVELRPFTLDGFHRQRARRQRNRRIRAGVVALVVAVGMGALIRPFSSGVVPADDPRSAFLGRWVTSDADGSHPTMTIAASGGEQVEIVVHDDSASVCSDAPSTMVGTGRLEGTNQLVTPTPVLTCDDGSQPEALSGPPLQDALRDLTFVHDPEADALTDSFGVVWAREGAEEPIPDQTASGGMWPQTSLEEVRAAQERADAGDPAYTWQVDPELVGGADPHGAKIFERFIREELGWEAFVPFFGGYMSLEEGGLYDGVQFLRCAPGRSNPLSTVYPDMPPEVRGCAPTLDDFRWETVWFTLEQPARTDPSGIWVVSYWELLEPGEPYSLFDRLYPDALVKRQVEQEAPPSESEVTEVLTGFLDARVEGAGAETYLHPNDAEEPPSPDEEIPLLYATTGGTPYERYEIERVQGPVWPTGWSEFEVRLFAEEGTVVEQRLVVVRQDGRLGVVYGALTGAKRISTTENGQAVPVSYSLLDGEVTFAAAPPWGGTVEDPTSVTLGGVGRGSAVQFTMFTVMADPRTGMGCDAGPPAADVDALVRSIRSNPDLETTAPVAASVRGIDALRMDVVAAERLAAGDCAPMVIEHLSLAQDNRMRLYLLDLPEGMSARMLAIATIALDSEFERVVDAAAPVLDSFEFHAR